MAHWEPPGPQIAPQLALLDVAVETDMQEELWSDVAPRSLVLPIRLAALRSDVPRRKKIGRDQGLHVEQPPRVALFLATGSVFVTSLVICYITSTATTRHAAAEFGLFRTRAQCAEGSMGLASNALDTRLLPTIWIMSTMSAPGSGPSMLSIRGSVLQRMRHDQSACTTEGH